METPATPAEMTGALNPRPNDTATTEEIATLIKTAMTLNGFTQGALAVAIGISEGQLSSAKTGRFGLGTIPLAKLNKLAESSDAPPPATPAPITPSPVAAPDPAPIHLPRSAPTVDRAIQQRVSIDEAPESDAPFEAHPLCLLLPDMSADDFAGLKSDIAQHGLRNPILLHDDKILDGRHRARACFELGIVANYEQWPGALSGADPLAFVLSENLHRRHLDASQRAMIAAQAMDLHTEAAQARQRAGTTLASREANPPAIGKAAATAAAAVGVSRASVERAIKVTKEGTAADVRDVTSGKATVGAKVREIAARTPKTTPTTPTPAATNAPKARNPTAKDAMQAAHAAVAALVALESVADALLAEDFPALVAELEKALARYRPMLAEQGADHA